MSALVITTQTLLANAGVTAIVGKNVFPVYIPQAYAAPAVIVHLISQEEEVLLQGATIWPEARVSLECRANDAIVADRLGEAVIAALRDKHLYQISGFEVTFRKEGTDETTSEDVTGPQGSPYSARRIIDHYLRFRTIPA